MRKYTTELSPTNNLRYTALRKGLKQVHIGGHVWLIGKQKQTKQGLHCVIYEPETYKEHHVWGKDVESLRLAKYATGRYEGNNALNENVKVYILTAILDKREHWCFDLSIHPEYGRRKVIYENGTIRNIDFQGVFEDAEILKFKTYSHKVKAIGYRKDITHEITKEDREKLYG